MVVLSAGIRSLLRKPKERTSSRPAEAPDPRAGSSRNGGRDHPGIAGGFTPESAKILMACCWLPIWPEVGAIALSLELIRGHDPEGGFKGRAHRGGAAVGER